MTTREKESFIRTLNPSVRYSSKFYNWFMNEDLKDNLTDVLPDSKIELKVGMKCSYKNSNGRRFKGFTIIGFDFDARFGKVVYLDMDGYWSPVEVKSIKLEK